jgi:hypothetical protein
MPTFRATIRLTGVGGGDAAEARQTIEAKLKEGGLSGCKIVSIDREGEGRQRNPVARRPRVSPAGEAWRRQSNKGGLVLLASVVWALWFFWKLSAYLAN